MTTSSTLHRPVKLKLVNFEIYIADRKASTSDESIYRIIIQYIEFDIDIDTKRYIYIEFDISIIVSYRYRRKIIEVFDISL